MLVHPVLPPPPQTLSVQPAAAINGLSSIAALCHSDCNPGLSDWATQTAAQLSPAQQAELRLLFWGLGTEGLGTLVQPQHRDFPAFLAALRAMPPPQLRDHLLYRLLNSIHYRVYQGSPNPPPMSLAEALRTLQSWEAYLHRLQVQQPTAEGEDSDPDNSMAEDRQRQQRAYNLLTQPDEVHAFVVAQLGFYWEHYAAAEWERARPQVEASALALAQVESSSGDSFDSLERITGRNLRSIFKPEVLHSFQHLRLVPCVHNGPYVLWFGDEQQLTLLFEARMPGELLPLQTEQVLNRLRALADPVRLPLLMALREQEEMSTQDIMEAFALEKSAASRHLRQLFANGLIEERRDEDGRSKFYRLNTQKLAETLQALNLLLG